MAEAIARHVLGARNDLFIASAGVAAFNGAMPSRETLVTLRHMGIEHDGLSRTLTADMVRNASLVLGMTGSHVRAALGLVGGDEDLADRIHPLDPLGELPDPIGQSQATYDALGERLVAIIPDRVETLLKDDES